MENTSYESLLSLLAAADSVDSIFNSSRTLSKAYTLYGLSLIHVHVQKRLLYFVHWVTMNCGFQNGSAFQSGISEWKCIPEWKFRMEVHSRMEVQNGSAFQSGIFIRGTKWTLRASVYRPISLLSSHLANYSFQSVQFPLRTSI